MVKNKKGEDVQMLYIYSSEFRRKVAKVGYGSWILRLFEMKYSCIIPDSCIKSKKKFLKLMKKNGYKVKDYGTEYVVTFKKNKF